jgi:hypothetical protein
MIDSGSASILLAPSGMLPDGISATRSVMILLGLSNMR